MVPLSTGAFKMGLTTHPYQLLDIDERVKKVLHTTPLFDGHNDLPQQPRCIFRGKIHENPKFNLRQGFEHGMTDIPRLREGKYFHDPLSIHSNYTLILTMLVVQELLGLSSGLSAYRV